MAMSTVGNLNQVSGLTTVNAKRAEVTSYKVSDELLAGQLKDWIEETLKEEDKDQTLSKLITSIVINKMYELSGKSEDELVETLLFKKLSDSFKGKLDEIELHLGQLQSEVQMLKWKDEHLGYTQAPSSAPWEPVSITGSDLVSESFTLTRDNMATGLMYNPSEEENKSIISKIKDFFKKHA